MSKAPAFLFYPKDYESDESVKLMTLAMEGAYIRLLSNQWLRGSIPEDLEGLARICRVSTKEMARLWPGVRPCFHLSPTEPGRLINGRLERERLKQKEHREERSNTGKKGASARWKRQAQPLNKDSSAITSAIDQPLAKNGLPFAVSVSGTDQSTPLPPENSGGNAARANLLVDRRSLEPEYRQLVTKIATLRDIDPTEVMGRFGTWGASRKVNPASMGDDRLLNVVLDLRAELQKLEHPEDEASQDPEDLDAEQLAAQGDELARRNAADVRRA